MQVLSKEETQSRLWDPMTFSIVARTEDGLGVATATRSLAVGSIVPAVAPGVGADLSVNGL